MRNYAIEEQARKEMFAILADNAVGDPLWHEEVARYALDTAFQAVDRRTLSLGTAAMPFFDVTYPERPEAADVDLKGSLGPMVRQPMGYRLVDRNLDPVYEFTCGDAVALTKHGRLFPPNLPLDEDGPHMRDELLPDLSRAAIRKLLYQLTGPMGIEAIFAVDPQAGPLVIFDLGPHTDQTAGGYLFIKAVVGFCLPRYVLPRIRLVTKAELPNSNWFVV